MRATSAPVRGEVWRAVLAVAIGLLLYAAVWGLFAVDERIGPRLWLLVADPILGVVCLMLMLHGRRRWPLPIALLTGVISAVSVTSVGSALVSTASLATHRDWRKLALAGLVWVPAGLVWELLFPVTGQRDLDRWMGLLTSAVMQGLVFAAAAWFGAYLGARRETLAVLQARVEAAERERDAREHEARANERARIAREMHDVLAHRISLIAMHSGALAYREDLPVETVRETAALLRDQADEAVHELRAVLGVLRGGSDESGQERGPQPSLAYLPALIDEAQADAAAPGSPVDVRSEVDLAAVPTDISRHAYRIVQECLTNSRKYAPGMPVSVALAGGPCEGLQIEVITPPAPRAPARPPTPGAGMGLLGLSERADLAGGRLSYGPDRAQRFVVRAWLPWEETA